MFLPAAERADSNYPECSGDHLATLGFARRTRELGFTMAQVRQLLALSDHDDKPCDEVDWVVEQQLSDVEREIADLSLLRDKLKRHGALMQGRAHRRLQDSRQSGAAMSALRPCAVPTG